MWKDVAKIMKTKVELKQKKIILPGGFYNMLIFAGDDLLVKIS